MGSEHSTQLNQNANLERQGSLTNKINKPNPNFRRQHTIANPENSFRTEERPRSISPGPSICSDSELPYISYTVNRPIGTDSPKLQSKENSKNFQKKNSKIRNFKSFKPGAHNIVVVKAASSEPSVENDPDVVRLQNTPMFLPIMRGTLNLPAQRDPEILERLDPGPFTNLCTRYQQHLAICSNLIATEQTLLSQKIREIDSDLVRVVNLAVERQKKLAKYIEKFQKINELSNNLNKCHHLLNKTIETLDVLNNSLDIEDRLEPFVWTTG